ncbi:MAG: DUF349 domain-containing protein [Muribaculaceae bacterium]
MDKKVPETENAAQQPSELSAPAVPAAETTPVTEPVAEQADAPAAEEALPVAEPAPVSEPAKEAKPAAPADPEAEVEAEEEMSQAIEEVAQEDKEGANVSDLDAEGTVARAAEILERPAAEIAREEVSRLRQHFAALRKAEVDAAREAFVAAGNAVEEFKEDASLLEEKFKEILEAIKEKKARYLAELEEKRAANLKRKNEIIGEIETLAQDTDNVNRSFPRYRELQDEFNALGEVPPTDETDVWRRYQEAREHYSDNLKINKELRDYDFKKNLEQKEQIIADAVTLGKEGDIVAAFRKLQELHANWRQIGPVAKELREEIWNRFKEATLVVNRRYQTYFEERKAREAENEAGKIAICERVEALDFSNLKTFAAWDEMTEKLKQAQEDWKKLGFASRKMNNALFNRFRATCDTFFALKAEYFRQVKEELAANLAAKLALVEKAEALKDSTDWKDATDQFVELQKEWKTIGTVPKKHSEAVWKRFQTACDYFFEQKKAATSGVRRTEQANLQAKRDLIKELDKINADMTKEDARALISDLQERWKLVGHVPFRDKDAVYEAFRNRIQEVRAEFDLGTGRQPRRDGRPESGRRSAAPALSERERQMRLLETRRAELRTYENNLGFLNAKSNSGNSLVQSFQQKIERLRADIATLEDKIRDLDKED